MFDDLDTSKPSLRQQSDAAAWRRSMKRMMMATTIMVSLMFAGYAYGVYQGVRFAFAMSEVADRMKALDDQFKGDLERQNRDRERKALKALNGKN